MNNPMQKNRVSSLSENKYFYSAFLIAAIALLLLAHYVFPEKSFFQILCKELGFAGLISIILIFTIEKFTRERHEVAADELMQRINKNLFYAVFKRYIPEKVFEQIEKNVMEAKVYRKEHEINYTIQEFPEPISKDIKDKYFLCIAQTTYILENLLDQDIQHVITVQLEKPLSNNLDQYCKLEQLRINNIQVDEEIINLKTEQHIIYNKNIDIPERGKVKISTKSILVKQKTDSEIWCSKLASDGMKLTISSVVPNLEVQAHANHGEKLEPTMDSAVTKQWALNHGIFPYQSIIFWWKPLNIQGIVNK